MRTQILAVTSRSKPVDSAPSLRTFISGSVVRATSPLMVEVSSNHTTVKQRTGSSSESFVVCAITSPGRSSLRRSSGPSISSLGAFLRNGLMLTVVRFAPGLILQRFPFPHPVSPPTKPVTRAGALYLSCGAATPVSQAPWLCPPTCGLQEPRIFALRSYSGPFVSGRIFLARYECRP